MNKKYKRKLCVYRGRETLVARSVMALPAIFGATWEDFVVNWCLGNPPLEDRQTAENALSELLRIWPERVVAMVRVNTRGLMFVSPAIENGMVLSACENLKGFENVLRRLKSGERAAYFRAGAAIQDWCARSAAGVMPSA